MRYLARALFVALLTLNASSALAFVVPEPCSILEASDAEDGQCPPTCVRCGCCAQPAVPAGFSIEASATVMQPSAARLPLDVLATIPRDILHVPKS